jgi:2-polyprenyl-6-methoxyphenol hydroxylase-like FAD-dependent oxidoreductase/predicted DsbA family dithiol-disulfide isomerase
MKVVIIGGGIAGLTMGIFLNRKGIDVVISERSTTISVRGNAFLMHSEGVSILKELSDGYTVNKIPGKIVDKFSLRRPSDEEIKFQKLDPWQCIKRKDIVEFLYQLIPAEKIRHGREFSHFIYKDKKAVAAVFSNGDTEYGDIFVGADGGNSSVREEMFGVTQYTPIEVKEILGLLKDEEICEKYSQKFTKFQHKSKGISFGMIPTSTAELVWYIQYDPRIMDIEDDFTLESMAKFCKTILKEFPPIVQQVLTTDDFKSNYIWHTRDFDLLPTFHTENIVLIGDAAHLALPFTSAGTTNALVDAHTLFNCLIEEDQYQQAFEKFYTLRAEHVAKQIQMGRDVKKDFLDPENKIDDDIVIPLISKQSRAVKKLLGQKEISIIYFTDPICSTCWIIQPQLRKLQLEYSEFVQIEYKMGGLLPSWDNYNRFGITQPSEVADHWDEVCSFYEMPVNKNIWLEDPLPSSYPPSIAFKAAQLQDTGKAVLFLRRIREMVFLEKKNIIKKEHLFTAAFDSGLDAARLLRDLEGKAQDMFREDLILSNLLEIKVLPTLFFSNKEGVQLALNGFQPYESFEEIIHQLAPNIVKSTYNHSPEFLFEEFQTLSSKEFAMLRDESEKKSYEVLHDLHSLNLIKKFESPSGNMWINNYNSLDDFK